MTGQYVWNLELRGEGLLSAGEHVARRIGFEVTVNTADREFTGTFDLPFEVNARRPYGVHTLRAFHGERFRFARLCVTKMCRTCWSRHEIAGLRGPKRQGFVDRETGKTLDRGPL